MKTILITGGAGFIGSHITLLLLNYGYEIVILDSFVNSKKNVFKRISKLSKIKEIYKKINVFEGDIRDINFIDNVFQTCENSKKSIIAVIHLAGLKSVNESERNQSNYWEVNVGGTENLIKVMEKYKCYSIIFSSSATIYGIPHKLPIKETAKINPINFYGKTKAAVENIFKNLSTKDKSKWRIVSLRYFNPAGAHESGEIGENPLSVSLNLFPLICKIVNDGNESLRIFGKDWNTPDGTCVRDYIHIMDLAEAHVESLHFLLNSPPNLLKLNIGNGLGYSVLQVVKTFEKVNNVYVPFKFVNRRDGDIEEYYADNSKAIQTLSWEPKYNLEDMCRDSWNWQKLNSK